jgi:hypothetical protein
LGVEFELQKHIFTPPFKYKTFREISLNYINVLYLGAEVVVGQANTCSEALLFFCVMPCFGVLGILSLVTSMQEV